jgi:hypothetical protein
LLFSPASDTIAGTSLQKAFAVVIVVCGVVVFAAPLPLGLGWTAALAGFVLGEALGVMGGVMWYLDDQRPKRAALAEPEPPVALASIGQEPQL